MALIENCAALLGLPIGPLAVSDETTLKLGLDIMTATRAEMGDAYVETGTEEFMEKMVTGLGRGGRRFGAGFYNYDEAGKRQDLWKGMTEHYPLADIQPSPEEVKQRLMYAQLIPTANCYADGVVADPQSADLGAIFGWGFPPWTGGPLSHIDTMGMEVFVTTAQNMSQRYGARFTPPQMFIDMAKNGETLYGGATAGVTYSKSALSKMLEADVVKIAKSLGIDASVDDLKADTIDKVLLAQAAK
jgi:3-hydroxyacyl-CoA dehydrogenase/enoyl-CoA hydratase/3-hydroxybutyryl-CoA epimerase